MQKRFWELVAFSLSGNAFLEFQEELEQVYKVYCASYEQALLLVETYRKEPELQREIQGIIEAVLWVEWSLWMPRSGAVKVSP